jgi:hypothetical protein
MAPELAVADGALGFSQAIEEIWPMTRGQRGWVHKTANVLNKLPDLRGVLQFFRDPHRAYVLRRAVYPPKHPVANLAERG